MEGQTDYKEILRPIFPNRREDHIENIIQIVQESEVEEEYMLEEMINLLTESGDSTLATLQDEAAGFGLPNAGSNYYLQLLESLFPNICYSFIRKFCDDTCQNRTSADVNEIIGEFLDGNNSITEDKYDSLLKQLGDMLPDADPDYLKEQIDILDENSDFSLESFIEKALEVQDYPKKKDYFKRQKTIDEIKMYTTNFSVEEYLTIIPEPFEYFYSPSYNFALADNDDTDDESYCIKYLLNCFPYLREKDIRKIFSRRNRNVVQASDDLARIPRHFKTRRKEIIINEKCENIQLLKELAFVKYKQEIKKGMKMMDELYRLARAEAEKYNLLQTCQCCFFDGLIPEECYFCKRNCPFCKECVAKGAEHVIGKGELTFPCLANCNSEFDISVLRMVLDKKVFEPLLNKIQIKELQDANIDGLETCPFCDFSMILYSEEKTFKCQNIECMEESCRECRHKSHVPLKCKEVEYDEDVKRRTYIENKMTEALVRTCWKCQKSFFKDSGCNKMTCPCGAKMCYVCGAANIGYDHFGETLHNKCPLYTRDLNQFHEQRIRNSAKVAKAELGLDNNPHLLKIDPAEGLDEYFTELFK